MGNSIENIISNHSGTATYDNYLSADNLFYYNNRIKNCFSLTGEYNQLLKSKSGNGFCIYSGNSFSIENVDATFPGITIAYGTLFKDTEANRSQKLVLIENNVIDVHTWKQATGNHIYAKRLIVRGNTIHALFVGGASAGSLYSVIGGVMNEVFFEDNKVNFDAYSSDFISGSSRTPCIFANTFDNVPVWVSIKDNHLQNCMIWDSTTASATKVIGEISGNTIENTLTMIDSTKTLFMSGKSNDLELNDNIISQNKENSPGFTLCPYNAASNLKVRLKLTGATGTPTFNLFRFGPYQRPFIYNAFGGIIKAIININDNKEKKKLIAEVNFSIVYADSTYSIGEMKAYNSGKILATFSSANWVLDMNGKTQAPFYLHPTQAYISIPASQMGSSEKDMDIEVTLEPISSINKFKFHITNGITGLRPAVLAPDDLGFEYFDVSIGKPVFAKAIDASTGAVTWADASGANA